MATIQEQVRERYGEFARKGGIGGGASCCGKTSCCGGNDTATNIGVSMGYSADELGELPEGANLGLGCGNPVVLASIQPGDTVVDLGSGAGIDCFLASKKTGPEGRVIGIDMTPDMLLKARQNAARGGYTNVEFREGTIEALPLEDNSVDVIISNCVVNLSPDKPAVFREAMRVLKPGGRVFISDLMLLKPLPWFAKRSVSLYVGCVAGAMLKTDYLAAMQGAGLSDVKVLGEASYSLDVLENDPTLRRAIRILRWIPGAAGIADSVVSVKVSATKASA